MTAETTRRTKRLADLVAGDVIVIDRGRHTAVVASNEPDDDPTMQKREFYRTEFVMVEGRLGAWTGNGSSLIEIASTIGGAA